MITPQQQQQIDSYLKTTNYQPPSQANGPSWHDAVQSKVASLPPSPTKPGYAANLLATPQRIWDDYQAAGRGILDTMNTGFAKAGEGVHDLAKGDVLGANKVGMGATTAAVGGLGNAVGAVFAPIGEAAKGVTPQTGNEWVDSATQGAATGSALAGPAGAIPGAGFGLVMHGKQAAQDWLMKQPAVASWAKANPELPTLLNHAFNVMVAAVGTKMGSDAAAKSGQTDILNTPVSEVPGKVGGNLMNTAGVVISPIKGAIDSLSGSGKSPEQTDQYIIDSYKKAIRPSVAGKNSARQLNASDQDALGAIRTIAENKDSLNLTDMNGDPTGKPPETVHQFSDAIAQTRQQLFKQYDAMQKSAGENGASVDLKGVASELTKVANDPVLQDTNPTVAQYAQKQANTFGTRGVYTTDQAQQAIAQYNNSLQAFYKNPTYENASKAAVDAMIANNLRSGLDSAIEDVSPQTEGQPGYQELKSKYGQLKSIEKDVAHRAVVADRANPKGLIDFTDVASGAELIKGLMSLNPANLASSAAIKGMAAWIKYINNPNTAVKNLFRAASNSSGPEAPQGISPPKGEGGIPPTKTVSVENIVRAEGDNPQQASLDAAFKQGALSKEDYYGVDKGLADQLKAGTLPKTPLKAVSIGGGKYQIVDGEHHYDSALYNGDKTVDIIIVKK